MSSPTTDEALCAPAELESGRRAVTRAEPGATPALLTMSSLLVLGDYTAKDLLPDRRPSGVRRPDILAGAVLAVARPAAYVGVQRLLPRPGHRG